MATIELTQGHVALVDDEVFESINRHRWKILKAGGGKFYACRTKMLPGRTASGRRRSTTVLMHREIAGALDGEIVDHINGDGLDNRRCNIRIGTQAQNLANMRKTRGVSKYKGVYWNKRDKKWRAQIGAGRDGQVIYLGNFDSEEDAAKAYNRAALERRGACALLNEIGRHSEESVSNA